MSRDLGDDPVPDAQRLAASGQVWLDFAGAGSIVVAFSSAQSPHLRLRFD